MTNSPLDASTVRLSWRPRPDPSPRDQQSSSSNDSAEALALRSLGRCKTSCGMTGERHRSAAPVALVSLGEPERLCLLERRLHLHHTELSDGEVQVFNGNGLLFRVVGSRELSLSS